LIEACRPVSGVWLKTGLERHLSFEPGKKKNKLLKAIGYDVLHVILFTSSSGAHQGFGALDRAAAIRSITIRPDFISEFLSDRRSAYHDFYLAGQIA
jgi:hypothetical protein